MKVDSPVVVQMCPPPKWVTWNYVKKHLSVRFHKTRDDFENVITWLKSTPYCSEFQEPYPREYAVLTCLALGLLFRDLETIQFFEEDEEGQVQLPPSLKHSSLYWSDVGVLAKRCQQMEADLKACLEAVQEQNEQNEKTGTLEHDKDKDAEQERQVRSGKHARQEDRLNEPVKRSKRLQRSK